MTLGHTYLTTSDAPKPLSRISLDLNRPLAVRFDIGLQPHRNLSSIASREWRRDARLLPACFAGLVGSRASDRLQYHGCADTADGCRRWDTPSPPVTQADANRLAASPSPDAGYGAYQSAPLPPVSSPHAGRHALRSRHVPLIRDAPRRRLPLRFPAWRKTPSNFPAAPAPPGQAAMPAQSTTPEQQQQTAAATSGKQPSLPPDQSAHQWRLLRPSPNNSAPRPEPAASPFVLPPTAVIRS